MPAKPVQAAACAWTGAVSSDWHVAGNWSACQGSGDLPPSATDTVTINSAGNQPIISSSVTIAGITLNAGTTLAIGNGGALTLTGDFVNHGVLTYAGNTAGGITFNGVTTLSGSGTWLLRSADINSGKTLNAGSVTLTLDGTLSIAGTFNGASGTVVFMIAAASSATVGGSGVSNFNHLTINASGKDLNISSGKTISVAGNFTKTAGSLGCGGGTCTLNFNGFSPSVISSTGHHPWKITVNSGKTVTTSSSFTLLGDLLIDGTFTQTAGTIIFKGSSAQAIAGTGGITFNNLTIDNASGVSLNQNVTVNGVLALQAGNLNTGANMLDLTSGATVSAAGGGDVVGNVRRNHLFSAQPTTYAFNHPNTQLGFSSIITSGTPSIIVNLAKTAPPTSEITNAVSRVYSVSASNITSFAANLSLRYKDAELLPGMVEANLRAWRKQGTPLRWTLQPSTVDPTNNYVTATSVTGFSDWAITDNGSPTAVRLLSFDAKVQSPDGAIMLFGMILLVGALCFKNVIKGGG